jgi:hypothetical protein
VNGYLLDIIRYWPIGRWADRDPEAGAKALDDNAQECDMPAATRTSLGPIDER